MIKLPIQNIYFKAKYRPPGYIQDVLSYGTIEGDILILSNEAYAELIAKYQSSSSTIVSATTYGPGTELKAILKKIGIIASPGCSCNARAKTMDENEDKEPGWCENNIETICDWLQEEATKRSLPFFRTAGKILIRKAISNYKKRARTSK